MIIPLKKILVLVLVIILVTVAITTGALAYIIYWPVFPSKSAEKVDILVRWGSSFSTVADQCQKAGIVRSAEQFITTAKLFKKTEKLRVGKFTLHHDMSNYHAMKALIEGPQTYINVTLPEGYDSRKFAQILEHHLDIDSAKFVSLVTDSFFIGEMGFNTNSLEGYLYPETYAFNYGLNAEQVAKTLVHQFKKSVPDSLITIAENRDYTFNDILTLASIIEGEAMVDEEMPIISSVYHNRLKRGMRLQADPTIQYIISDGPRRLLLRDLKIDSPYNTYKYSGLPPGPINNPSAKAIYSALFPIESDYLYFVANGDGTHSFSETYQQHLRAKQRFDQVRERVKRGKKQAVFNEK